MKMNEIMKFENVEFGEVRVLVLNGKEYFNLEDVCFKLGYVKIAKGKEYLRKELIEGVSSRLDIKGLSTTDNKFISITKQIVFNECYISEEDLYDFIFESRCDKARKFRKWVTSEVLPSIRKDGGYISDGATAEQVEKLIDKYSFRKITSVIANSNIMELEGKITEMYESNMSLKRKEREKYHQKLSKTEYKLKTKEHIRKAIENRPMPSDGIQASVEAVIRYSIIDKLDKELLTTTRKSTSNKIAHKNKMIDDLMDKLEIVKPNIDKYIELDYHGLSNNQMYQDNKRTWVYSKWIKEFPSFQVPPAEYWTNVDFSKPVKLYLKFKVVSERYDTNNLCKSIIDQIFNREMKIDDNIVKDVVCELDGYCNTFDDAKIMYYIQNV